MDEATKRILELRAQDITGVEIAKIVNEEGFRTPTGLEFTPAQVALYVSSARKNDPSIPALRRGPYAKTRNQKPQEMITLPAMEPTRRAIVIVTDVNSLADVLKEVANG